jgi:predicted small lipoprotein YifL
MQINMPQIVRLTLVVSLVGLAVAGCGRKGDLDPPSVHATKGGDVNQKTKEPGTENKPFLLDPLL